MQEYALFPSEGSVRGRQGVSVESNETETEQSTVGHVERISLEAASLAVPRGFINGVTTSIAGE